MKQFLKICNVYRRPEGYFAFGLLNTPHGGIAVPPALQAPLAADPVELGKMVRTIFTGLPDKITEIDLASAGRAYDEYLKEIGFPKPNAFGKKASLVILNFDGAGHEVIACKRDERGAFLPVNTAKLASDLNDEALGSAILEGLAERV